MADPDRLGVGGWSYGGILTNALIASDTRFKAAVSGAGSALFHTMYGTDQYIVQYEPEMGLPWKAPDVVAARCRTRSSRPTASRRRRCSWAASATSTCRLPVREQMYQALKTLGIETQLVVYPGQYHSLTIPSYLRDRLQRYLAWWNKYLQPKPAKTPTAGK